MDATQISYTELSPSNKTIKKNVEGVEYSALYINFTIKTNYHNLCSFLSKLGALAIPLSAYVVDMNYTAIAPADQNLSVNIGLLAYQLP